jgi:hypothetical protein
MTWHPTAPILIVNGAAYGGGWPTVDLKLDHLGAPTGLPASRVLALCVAQHGAAGGFLGDFTAIRPDDDVTNWLIEIPDGQGASAGDSDGSGAPQWPLYTALSSPTGPTGQVQWASSVAMIGKARSLWLLGWLDWTDDGAPGGTTVFGPAVVPGAWTDIDMSAVIGAIDALTFLRMDHSAGSNDAWGCRRDGDPEDYCWPTGWAPRPRGITSRGWDNLFSVVRSTYLPVASAGIIEHEGAAQTIQLDLLGHAPCTVANDVVFATGAPPLAWGTTLDLTQDALGAPTGLTGESLTELRFTLRAGGGAVRHVAVRRNGDANDYFSPHTFMWPLPSGGFLGACLNNDESISLVVPTDATGLIEWVGEAGTTWDVELIAHNGSAPPPVPPVVTGTGPVGVAVSPGDPITFETTDDVQVIEATLRLEIRHGGAGPWTVAMLAGTWQGPCNGTKTPNAGNGFDVSCSIHPPMSIGFWEARAYCEDGGALSDTDTWSWTVVANPPTCPRKWPASGDLVTQDPIVGFGLEDNWGITLASVGLVLRCIDDERLLVVAGTINAEEYKAQILANGANGYDCQGRLVRDLDDRHWTLELAATSAVGVPLP